MLLRQEPVLIRLKPEAKKERQQERAHQKRGSSLYKYFSEDEQKKASVNVDKNGIFYNSQNEPLNGVYLYVVLEDGRIIIAIDDKTYVHSALANGKKVLAAGKIEVVVGKVDTVTNESGHYKPTDEEMRYMLQEFLFLTKNLKLKYVSHCDAAQQIAREHCVSAFLENTYSLIRVIDVNKMTRVEMDEDHYIDEGSKSRYNRKPKLIDLTKDEGKKSRDQKPEESETTLRYRPQVGLFNQSHHQKSDSNDEEASVKSDNKDTDKTSSLCPRSCIII